MDQSSDARAVNRHLGWILWPTVLPAAVVAGLLAGLIVDGISILTGDKLGVVLHPLSAAVANYALIRVGAAWAPQYKRVKVTHKRWDQVLRLPMGEPTI